MQKYRKYAKEKGAVLFILTTDRDAETINLFLMDMTNPVILAAFCGARVGRLNTAPSTLMEFMMRSTMRFFSAVLHF